MKYHKIFIALPCHKLYANNIPRTFWSIIMRGRHLPVRMFGMIIVIRRQYTVNEMYLEERETWKMTWWKMRKMRRGGSEFCEYGRVGVSGWADCWTVGG